MLLFHVMSKINVNVQTTTDAGKVVLEDAANTDANKRYTKVEILNFLPDGKVLMGTGAVSLTNTTRTSSVAMTKGTYTAESGSDPAHVTFSYFMMPQALSWTTPSTGTIGLRITTPDGNIYTVEDLSKCYATVTNTNLLNPYTNPNSSGKYKIDTWYPCYQYNYTVRLTKTGILNITATLLDWETVSAEEETVQIK